MPTPPLVAPVSPAPQARSTPQPELRVARAPVPIVNGTPQRMPVAQVAQVYGGILLNGSLSVPSGSNGTMPAGTNGLFGSMRVPGSPAGGPFANGLAGSMRVPSPGPNMAGSMPTLGTGAMIPLPGSMRVPSPERPEGATMLFGSMRIPSPERHEGEVLSGSCSTPLWAAPASRGSPQPGRGSTGRPVPAVPAPCAGYAMPTPFLPTKRPESPMMSHLRHLGTLNPSPEYQHLLNIVMTQEQAKQDLLERLEETERQLQQCRIENEMLRNGQNFRSNSVTSKTAMRSVAEGKEDGSVTRTRSGSMRMRRSNSSRPRFTDSLVVPFSGKEALQDRFVVEWQTCLHVGTMNGLQSGETMTISRFFKGKSKSNSGQRIIKAVRKSQVPFFRLLEQHIEDQRSFDHPHVCRLIDAFEDEEHVYQVFEFLSGPSLLEKILSDTQFSERDAAAATKAILLAIGYLHGLSIAHQNVHLENMRFATHPRKKESGSCYCDQLKLMDLGLSLNRKLIPGILNAASQPATESSATLPLLAPLGIQNSLGSVCLPPECQGVCSSYAQLATAAPCMLRRTDSTQLHRSPSPTLQRKTSEDFGQTSSISSVGQDSSSRRAKELLLLLQAGDVWSAGCILHILLSGQIPVTVVDSDKGGDVPKLPLLLGVSAGAIDTCAMRLHGMPRRRATAESALENNWFSQCERIQKAHRSQKRNLSLAAPRSPEFFEKLRQTSAMTCLRRLFHSVRAVRNRTSLAIPGPEEDNKDSGTNARAAADAMCAEAFEWLLFSSGATSAGGIPLRKLNSMIQSVIQSESKVPRNDLEMRVDTLISSTQFAEMIWATCA